MKKKIIVDGKETNYSITEDARIFNDVTGRELKGTYQTNEYHSVQLVIEGKPRTFMFHRLVAEAFCENPNNYSIVDHIDRNKRNDNASNLRWVDSRTNALNIEKKKESSRNEKYNGNFTDGNWKPILGYEDYMISDTAKVVNTTTDNIMIPQDRHGYLRVNVAGAYRSLHILVWETFNNQKIPSGMQVDHIDGDKSNNNLTNLRLVSSSGNMKNAYANGHRGAVAVKQYSLTGEYIRTYSTIREAANAIGAQEAGLKDATLRHGTCANYYWLRENDSITIDEVINGWVPKGFKIIPSHPTYCIDEEGSVYNKRNKNFTPMKFTSKNIPFIIIKGRRYYIEDLLNETFNNG